MQALKGMLRSAPVLQQLEYESQRPIMLTVDTSPIAIGWAVGQDDEEGRRFATRFGARTLS